MRDVLAEKGRWVVSRHFGPKCLVFEAVEEPALSNNS